MNNPDESQNSYKQILKDFYSLKYFKGILNEFLWDGIILSIYNCLKSVLINTVEICLNIVMIPFWPILAVFIKHSYDDYDRRVQEDFKLQFDDKFKLVQWRKK